MAEHPTSNAQLILALLNTIVQVRPGFDEALDAIRAAIESPTVWRCFHCDEIFTDHAAAEEHFGQSQLSSPACKVDAAEYRRMEECCHSHHAEDTELHRALHAKDAEMRSKVREAEEQGYARGLEDAKKHPETMGLQRVDWLLARLCLLVCICGNKANPHEQHGVYCPYEQARHDMQAWRQGCVSAIATGDRHG